MIVKHEEFKKKQSEARQGLISMMNAFSMNGDGWEAAKKELLMQTIIDQIHPYKISRGKDGRVNTFVEDATKPHGRRQVRKASMAEMYKYLLNFYGQEDAEAEKENAAAKKTYSELFGEFIEYKGKFTDVPNKSKGISPSTLKRYEKDYDNYLAGTALAELPIGELTSQFLEESLVDIVRKRGMYEKCAKNVLSNISNVFEYAFRSRYIKENIFQFVDKDAILSQSVADRLHDDSERVLTVSELTDLRASTLRHEKKHPDYMPDYATELAMMTGMRVGEVAALKWSSIDRYIHIDFSEHRLDYKDKPSILVIGEPKNGKHRKIPVTKEIEELMTRIRANGHESPEGFLFARADGRRYTAHDISCAVSRRAEEAGIGKVSIHRIRRTVSSMLREILPAKTVANLLGHLEGTNERFYNYDVAEEQQRVDALTGIAQLSDPKAPHAA